MPCHGEPFTCREPPVSALRVTAKNRPGVIPATGGHGPENVNDHLRSLSVFYVISHIQGLRKGCYVEADVNREVTVETGAGFELPVPACVMQDAVEEEEMDIVLVNLQRSEIPGTSSPLKHAV
jgi:hypothetical protein